MRFKLSRAGCGKNLQVSSKVIKYFQDKEKVSRNARRYPTYFCNFKLLFSLRYSHTVFVIHNTKTIIAIVAHNKNKQKHQNVLLASKLAPALGELAVGWLCLNYLQSRRLHARNYTLSAFCDAQTHAYGICRT